MVNVDDLHRERLHHLRTQNLHVARHDDEVYLMLSEQGDLTFFLGLLRFFRDGKDVIVDPKLLRDRFEIGMVTDDQGNVATQFSRAMPQEEIVETVVGLGYENGNLLNVSMETQVAFPFQFPFPFRLPSPFPIPIPIAFSIPISVSICVCLCIR